MTTEAGEAAGTMKYFPFGESRNSTGTIATDRLFTGQRLDDTGLYYYGGRYYDPSIGRFVSADPFVQWSNGFDVVSSPLTVNAIPAGLGKVLAPKGNYPGTTLEITVNPQSLDRYSYVLNSPLRYNDPYGWWTLGFGLQGLAGFGLGVTGSASIVMDGNLNFAIVTNTGGGGYGGCSASGGVQFQYTSAESISDLQGLSLVSGASSEFPNIAIGRTGVSGGLEHILGLEDKTYNGVNVNIGIGVGVGPFEIHSMIENSWVYSIFDNKSLSSSSEFTYYSYYSPQYDAGTGFTCWGVNEWGAEVYSINDPSSYSWSDWYGYY